MSKEYNSPSHAYLLDIVWAWSWSQLLLPLGSRPAAALGLDNSRKIVGSLEGLRSAPIKHPLW